MGTLDTSCPPLSQSAVPTLARLPFVDCKPGHPARLWVVRPIGEWSADCATGRRYAEALVAFMKIDDNTPQLAHIVRAMPPGDAWTGIEVGFMQGIAAAAVG